MDLVSSSQQPDKNANTRRKERMERMAEYLKAQNREKEAQNHAREILNRLAEEEKMKREKIDHIDPKTQRNLERFASNLLKNGSSGGGASRKRKGRKTRKASRKTARKMRR